MPSELDVLRAELTRSLVQCCAARARPPTSLGDAAGAASESMRAAIARFADLQRAGTPLPIDERLALAALVLELQRAFEELRDHAAALLLERAN